MLENQQPDGKLSAGLVHQTDVITLSFPAAKFSVFEALNVSCGPGRISYLKFQ